MSVERDSGSAHIRATTRRKEFAGKWVAMASFMALTAGDVNQPNKSCEETASGQNLFRCFQGEPNDVGKGSFIMGNNEFALLLNGVTPCLVEGVNPAQI